MHIEDNVSVGHPIMKLATAWGAVLGFNSWGEVAAALAGFYSLLLILEWFYRRFWRDIFVKWGWLEPRYRRRSDQYTDEKLYPPR